MWLNNNSLSHNNNENETSMIHPFDNSNSLWTTNLTTNEYNEFTPSLFGGGNDNDSFVTKSFPNGTKSTHEEENNNNSNFKSYSPLLGPAPFHSTFEKLFLHEKSPNREKEQQEEQLDIISPLFDCEEYKEEPIDNFSLNPEQSSSNFIHNNNEIYLNPQSPNTSKKSTSPSPKTPNRKRSKTKKSKVVLSLQDFQCMEATEQIPVEQNLPNEKLEPNASPVLWVGNIGPLVTEEQVKDEFSVFGNVINLHILRDK